MPIKFRCRHCRQFLGISRNKAGCVVDCPTCGRSIRVPDLDGHVDPLPKPDWDPDDSRLNDALDELASIGKGSKQETNPANTPAEAHDEGTPASAPVPASSPASVLAPAPEPVPAPEPIPIEPPVVAELVAPPPGQIPPVTAPQPDSLDDPFASLAAAMTREDPPIATRTGRRKKSWRSLLTASSWDASFLTALGVAALVMFSAGYFFGSRQPSDGGEPANPSGGQASATSGNDEPEADGADATASSSAPSVQGRVTFKTESGGSKPDRGARVFVVPESRSGTSKLAAAAFHDVDSQDFHESAKLLQALGGAVAVADEDGKFQLTLPGTGSFHVLVLSHSQPRDDSEPIDPAVQSVLESYFDRPTQLLGSVRYHFDQLRYNGEGTQPWDHSFNGP